LTTLAANLQHLANWAALADAAGQLQDEQVRLLHDRGWLKLLMPRAVGGGELPLPEMVKLEEAIAAADGSCGWVVTLCAGAGWFAGFMPPDLARRIAATPDVCLAGSGAPTGHADRDGDGWRLNGQWGHASGAPLATHFTLNARLREGGLPLLDERGQPRVRAFVVPATDVHLVADTWHSIGLRASASGAFALQGVRALDAQAFDIAADRATSDGPLYRFPFEPLAFVTLAACIAGMARHFLALAEPLVERRIAHLGAASSQARRLRLERLSALEAARAAFHGELEAAWRRVEAGDELDAAQADRVNGVSRALADAAREGVDAVYPACGLRAADPRSDINRVWRDLHTATQHSLWLQG
jgi:alkylation response protein AidB-like acyl-CoA dehydrogenase